MRWHVCSPVRPLPTFLIVATFALTAFSGCLTDPGDLSAGGAAPLTSLSVYEYRHGGDDGAFLGLTYGWMARVTNVLDAPVHFFVEPLHPNVTRWAPATTDEWRSLEAPAADRLEPGESRLYLFRATFVEETRETGFRVSVLDLDPEWDGNATAVVPSSDDNATEGARVTESAMFQRTLEWSETFTRAASGHHVQTATVGVWLDGTSFYTNIAELDQDPEFPVGYDTEFNGAPLPVYVYASQANEQPPRSKDHCYFVTIPGYNDLLKSQAEGGTNVRWLAPGEAYTRDGAEDHHLYGDVLVFMNTIIKHDGAVGPTGPIPDPLGPCFDPMNAVPSLPLPLP